MSTLESLQSVLDEARAPLLFDLIAKDLYQHGYSVQTNALPAELATLLAAEVRLLPAEHFKKAGIGRDHQHVLKPLLRGDHISWITGNTQVTQAWLEWAGSLQRALNQRLLLGLFSFESHFAHYAIGDVYTKHQDAFKGETNRVLSLVTYLNPDWNDADGGELVLYPQNINKGGLQVSPCLATLVVFLSEEVPHEVLAALVDRFSIAGWFSVNNSPIIWPIPKG